MILICKNLVALKKLVQINIHVVCTLHTTNTMVFNSKNYKYFGKGCRVLCTIAHYVVLLSHDKPCVYDTFPFFTNKQLY